jgi:putative membrane protein
MKYFAIRTLAILVTSYITKVGVPLVFALSTAWVAFVVTIVLAIINHTIKPFFMLVSIPINVVTLGLFSFVINGMMILLAAKIVDGFSVPSLLMAVYFSVVLSVVNWVLHYFD